MKQIATDDYGFLRLIIGGCANVSQGLGDASNAKGWQNRIADRIESIGF